MQIFEGTSTELMQQCITLNSELLDSVGFSILLRYKLIEVIGERTKEEFSRKREEGHQRFSGWFLEKVLCLLKSNAMENTSRNKIKVSEIQKNIDLLKEISDSSICMLEGWSTPVEEAIWHLEDYLLALEHIEKQKEEIYKQNVILGELLSKANQANEGKA